MGVMKHAVLGTSLVAGAMMLSGTGPASAATLAPALAQSSETAAVHTVNHNWWSYGGHYGRHWSYPRYGYSRHYRRSGPAIGFGLSVPGFSFGVGVPTYYGQSYGYHPHSYRHRYGRISR